MNAFLPDRAALRTIETTCAVARLLAAVDRLLDRLPEGLGDVGAATARTAPPAEYIDTHAGLIEFAAAEIEVLVRRLPLRRS